MNLKEFDAKQFLLEKGERVGLGIAVTLMVLMLIVSLFMPSRGFFSGSPAAKAEVLKTGTASLEAKLKDRNVKPGPADSPPTKSERHLIALDTTLLESQIYETGPWYEPAVSISSGRQPPLIKNITEAVIKVVHIPIDTYIFDKNFTKVRILRNPDKRASADGKGANNNVSRMTKMLTAPGGPAGRGGRPFNNATGQNVQGADEKAAYETPLIPLDKLTGGEDLARQLQPLRMAIIAASFPYKAQLEEFKTKLRLASIEDVLNEPVDDPNDNKEKLAAFRFLGVEVQRKEFDLKGKEVSDWKDLDLHANYKVWLMHSGLPFEEDDPKYDPIKFYSLVWPRLREFHEEKPREQMGMAGPRGRASRAEAVTEAPRHEGDSKYPDVESELPSIQATLKSLADVEPQKIAGKPGKFQVGNVDFFNPNPPLENQVGNGRQPGAGAGTQQEAIIPEHCLVRLIDVTIEPGHYYRYRVKIKMANPNYNNPNVASPDYKKNTELKSRKWLEVPLTVSVKPETIYYVVDQKHVKDAKREDKPTKDKDTARFHMWNREPERDRQVVFQFHRWIESTLVGSEVVPIGEWSVADRVFVARGEYIGQKVKVDLPVWKYTLDSFVLPIEDQKAKLVRNKTGGAKIPTGVTVDFGEVNRDNETILVDFEGGRESLRDSTSKVDDVSGIQVLMLSPDGRLRARNGAADANDKEREDRRAAVLKRIEEVREGKTAGGAAPRGGGLDGPRGR